MSKVILCFMLSSVVCLAAEPTIDTSDVIDLQGGHAYTVTNEYAQPLTGIIVRVDRQLVGGATDLGRYIFDSTLNPSQPSLQFGQSYTFHLGSDKDNAAPMHTYVEAAVFADGAGLGEPASIRSLWQRRDTYFSQMRDALDLADRSMTDPKDRTNAIKVLTEAKEAKRSDTSQPKEMRMESVAAFNTVIGNLRDAASNADFTLVIAKLRKEETDQEANFRKQKTPEQINPSR